MPNLNLQGRIAVVIGGTSGLGRAIALGLAEAGADVVLAARTLSDLEEVAGEVEARGRRALAVRTDVTDRDALEHLVESTMLAFGRLDIVTGRSGRSSP